VTDSIVLVGAVTASLASGVLIAYGVCLGLFRIFQMHALQAAQERQVVGIVQVVEG
jgi:hypothetical protein